MNVADESAEVATEPDAVYELISPFAGRADGAPREAIGVVSKDRIADWCEAIGDENPIYRDAAAARAAGYDDIVCPPAALMLWTMAGLRNQAQAIVGPEGLRLRQILRDNGFSVSLAVNCDQEYGRYLRLGDRVVVEAAVGSISERKETALGSGYFHSILLTYRTTAGEIVGRTTMRTLTFKPRQMPPAAPVGDAASRRPPPIVNRDTAFFWDGARKGQLVVQQCDSCGRLRNPPEPMCPMCNSLQWHAEPLSGAGTIYSYVIMHHPKLQGFDPPYAIALVDLDEGVRMVAGISAPIEDVAVGRRVSTAFRDLGDFTVPDFVPASEDNG
jgi:uncharacterized OB-fold protein